jgi:hypothetical protein
MFFFKLTIKYSFNTPFYYYKHLDVKLLKAYVIATVVSKKYFMVNLVSCRVEHSSLRYSMF